MTHSPAPSKRALLFRLPGEESALNAQKLARTCEQAGLCVTMVPYWPDGQDAWHTQIPLLETDIGSAPRVSEFALQRHHGLTLDLLELLAHSFATEPITPDLLLPESIWHQRMRGIAVRLIEMFDREQPDVIFIAHGAEIISRLLTEVAAFKAIPVLFWESGFFPDHLYVDAQAPHFFRGLCASDTQSPSSEVTPDTLAFIQNWRQARQSKYLQDSAQDAALLAWKARDDRPILFLAGQVPSDANAVVALGEHASLEALYAATLAKLPSDWRILFKPHPKAAPDAITLSHTVGDDFMIAAVDIHTAIDNSHAVLVHSSNAGLEAALLGKPVIVTGQPVYSGYRLSHDVGTSDNLNCLSDLPSPSPRDVALIVQHLRSNSLLEDADHQQLFARVRSAKPPAPQLPLTGYYSQKVQALVATARALHEKLQHTPKLAQALALLTPSQQTILFENLSSADFLAHPYGGPCAPPLVLAPHPVRGRNEDGIETLAIRLEECAFPKDYLLHTLKHNRSSVRIGCRFDTSTNPASAQRFSPDDIAYLCADLQRHYTLVENNPENPDYQVATLIISPRGLPPQSIDTSHYLDWHIPPEAFSYPTPMDNPLPRPLRIDGAQPHFMYGPYLPLPQGEWKMSWQSPDATLYEHAKIMLAWAHWKHLRMEVVEHNTEEPVRLSSTPFFKFRINVASKGQARYEFRIKCPATSKWLRSASPNFSGVWLKWVPNKAKVLYRDEN